MDLLNVVIVGAGGFLGAAGRYLCSGLINQRSNAGVFPLGTLAVNILGAFLIGFLSELFAQCMPERKRLLLFFTTGITGGFTTFSTFSLETMGLFEQGHHGLGVLNILLSVLCCLAGVVIGKLCVQKLAGTLH